MFQLIETNLLLSLFSSLIFNALAKKSRMLYSLYNRWKK